MPPHKAVPSEPSSPAATAKIVTIGFALVLGALVAGGFWAGHRQTAQEKLHTRVILERESAVDADQLMRCVGGALQTDGRAMPGDRPGTVTAINRGGSRIRVSVTDTGSGSILRISTWDGVALRDADMAKVEGCLSVSPER